MRWTRRRAAAGLMGGLLIGGLAAAATAGWPFGPWTIDPERFATGRLTISIQDALAGDRSQGRTVAADSPEARRVRDWLKAHSQGWKSDFNSYAPYRKVRGELFTLDFLDSGVVLNYRLPGPPERYSQVSREIDPADVPDVFDGAGPRKQPPPGREPGGSRRRGRLESIRRGDAAPRG